MVKYLYTFRWRQKLQGLVCRSRTLAESISLIKSGLSKCCCRFVEIVGFMSRMTFQSSSLVTRCLCTRAVSIGWTIEIEGLFSTQSAVVTCASGSSSFATLLSLANSPLDSIRPLFPLSSNTAETASSCSRIHCIISNVLFHLAVTSWISLCYGRPYVDCLALNTVCTTWIFRKNVTTFL